MLKEIVRRTITPSDIVYDTKGDSKSALDASEIGRVRPLVLWRGSIIREILNIEIDSTGFVPTVVVLFKDVLGLTTKYGYPSEDDIIKVRVDPRTNATASLRVDFKIVQTDHIGDYDSKVVRMEGVLDVNGFYLQGAAPYRGMTSWEVFQQSAKNWGLGFYSNVSSSVDKMTWLNSSAFGYVFLQEVIKYAWISKNALCWGYCDWYYNLTYVDIQKAFSQDRDRSKVNLQNEIFPQEIFTTPGAGESAGTPFFMTNHPNYRLTNLFIDDFEIMNSSTEVGINYGYSRLYGWYDLDGNWQDGRAGTTEWDALTDLSANNSQPKTIWMNSEKDNSYFYRNQLTTGFSGKLNTNNVHDNYYLAEGHNDWNIENAQRFSIVATCNRTFLFPYRFQKILMVLFDTDRPEDGPIDAISGDWVVSGMNWSWDNEDGPKTSITLIKRMLDDSSSDKDVKKLWETMFNAI